MIRGAIVLAALLATAVAHASSAEPSSEGKMEAFLRSGARGYLSEARTIGGVGGGVGVRVPLGAPFFAQADLSYLSQIGNVGDLRLGFGIQRSGTWSPAARASVGMLFGDRLAFLTPSHPTPVPGPAFSLGIAVAPLRWTNGTTTVSVLELELGVGSDFPGLGLVVGVGLLETGFRF